MTCPKCKQPLIKVPVDQITGTLWKCTNDHAYIQNGNGPLTPTK